MFDDTGLGSAMALSGLEDRIKNLESRNKTINDLQAKLSICQSALAYYGNPSHYSGDIIPIAGGLMEHDKGEKARSALAATEDKGEMK